MIRRNVCRCIITCNKKINKKENKKEPTYSRKKNIVRSSLGQLVYYKKANKYPHIDLPTCTMNLL